VTELPLDGRLERTSPWILWGYCTAPRGRGMPQHSGFKSKFRTIRRILATSRTFRITCESYTTPWPVGAPKDVLLRHARVAIADSYMPVTASAVLCTTVSSTLFRWCQVLIRPIVHWNGRSTCTAPATMCTPSVHNFEYGAHYFCQTASEVGVRFSFWCRMSCRE